MNTYLQSAISQLFNYAAPSLNAQEAHKRSQETLTGKLLTQESFNRSAPTSCDSVCIESAILRRPKRYVGFIETDLRESSYFTQTFTPGQHITSAMLSQKHLGPDQSWNHPIVPHNYFSGKVLIYEFQMLLALIPRRVAEKKYKQSVFIESVKQDIFKLVHYDNIYGTVKQHNLKPLVPFGADKEHHPLNRIARGIVELRVIVPSEVIKSVDYSVALYAFMIYMEGVVGFKKKNLSGYLYSNSWYSKNHFVYPRTKKEVMMLNILTMERILNMVLCAQQTKQDIYASASKMCTLWRNLKIIDNHDTVVAIEHLCHAYVKYYKPKQSNELHSDGSFEHYLETCISVIRRCAMLIKRNDTNRVHRYIEELQDDLFTPSDINVRWKKLNRTMYLVGFLHGGEARHTYNEMSK